MATHIDTNTWKMDWKTSYFFFSFARKQVTSYSHSPENKLLLLLISQKTSYFFFSFARKQVTSSSHSPENKLLLLLIRQKTSYLKHI